MTDDMPLQRTLPRQTDESTIDHLCQGKRAFAREGLSAGENENEGIVTK